MFKGDNYIDFYLKGLLYRIDIYRILIIVYGVFLFNVNKIGKNFK